MSDGGISEFIAEAQEIADALNTGLIALEDEVRSGEVTPGLVNELFRSAHSLKGISGMFGLDQIGRLSHAMESILDGMRLGKVAVDASALDALFGCIETFNLMIAGAAISQDIDEAILEKNLAAIAAVAGGEVAEETTDILHSSGLSDDVLGVLTEYEEHRLRENLKTGKGLYLLRTSFALSNFDVGLAELDTNLKGMAEIVTKLPSSEVSDPETICFDIIIGSECTDAQLQEALSDERIAIMLLRSPASALAGGEDATDGVNLLTPLEPEVAAVAAPIEKNSEPTAETELPENALVRTVAQTVRVDIRRLDRLMNLVGELSLIRMAFESASEEVRRELGFVGVSAELHKHNRNFERSLGELQAGIMEVRMVPLANLFERMVRTGRKIARQLNREVRIELVGETTELDKLLVEELADPLMHIIRNSIDHGMEDVESRVAAGKSREGNVTLSAEALGNHVIIKVKDDGKGMAPEGILERAIDRGFVTRERSVELSRNEILNLIFLPGFSTRDEVSEFSGRGVGMDVVKTNITKLSGMIHLESAAGVGTTCTITLPITLAIIPALVVTVTDLTYAIPLNNVSETVAVNPKELRTIERREVLTVRGATVPVVDLRHVFGLEGDRPDDMYGVVI